QRRSFTGLVTPPWRSVCAPDAGLSICTADHGKEQLMNTLLKIGLAAVALTACVTALIAKAGGKTQTLYAVTDLGPGSASKVSNPDASGTFLVVGSTPDAGGNNRATVWSVSTDGTVDDVFTYGFFDSLAIDVNDHGMVVGNSQNGAFNGAFVDVPGVGVEFLP